MDFILRGPLLVERNFPRLYKRLENYFFKIFTKQTFGKIKTVFTFALSTPYPLKSLKFDI